MTAKALLVSLLAISLLQACKQEAPNSTLKMEAADTASGISLATLNLDEHFVDAKTSTYQDLLGRGFELDSFVGKRVFINYWATWCAPCIRELPALSRAAQALAGENTLFLFASDEKPETILEFISEREFSGNFIKLNGFFGGHGIDAVPSSILFDEQGQILQTWAGEYEWDQEHMLAEIRNAPAAQ